MASTTQTAGSLTRAAGRPVPMKDGLRRAARRVPLVRDLAAEGSGHTGPRAKGCAGITPERHREGMVTGSVRRREASGLGG